MKIIQLVLFSFCVGICYYAFSISALGITSALDTSWWIEMGGNHHLLHITKNFIGIGFAAFIPSLLVYNYEFERKWVSLSIIIVCSMMLHGNAHEMSLS
ncbi:MAG: hypothetical protein P8M49_08125, partial [Thalassotalea sp.]|nr:hypothetical protein [Thalassotalea sp.]